MAQTEGSWIRDVITLAQTSPIVQVGVAIGLIGFGVYSGRSAVKRLFGNGDDSTEKTRLALEALSKVNDAQARYIELLISHESHFDITDVNRNITRPLPPTDDIENYEGQE